MRSRWFDAAPLNAPLKAGDVVVFVDGGVYTRIVVRVAKDTIYVSQPKGITPRTRRVKRRQIKEVWAKRAGR